MRIDELAITNFKCFENDTFRFDPHFNVIIGKNASGKTSLLDALSIVMSSYISGFYGSGAPKLIAESDVRKKMIDGQPRPQIPVEIKSVIALHEAQINASFQVLQIVTDRTNKSNLTYGFDVTDIADLAFSDKEKSRLDSPPVVLPLLEYYGTNRLWGWRSQTKSVPVFKQDEGFKHAYDSWNNTDSNRRFLSFQSFLSWYKTLEDEVTKFEQPNDRITLELVRNTIAAIIPDWTSMAYSHKDEDLIGTFKDEHGVVNKLPFSNLSDGYRNMIGMVADMVYRCIQLNPGLKENAIAGTEGIVLIDELDLHLHPEWQRSVVDNLKRVFPKIQFITTTHSPFIIQSLKQEELIVLDEHFTKDQDPFRKSVEEIATDEMQVSDMPRSHRFTEMVDIAKEYFTLVKLNNGKSRDKIDAAKKRLDELRIQFASDPAYVAMLEAQVEKSEHHEAGNKN